VANVTIAVAVGIFGILSIFALLQTSGKETHLGQLWWYMKGTWKLAVLIVLSLAYWGVSLLGFTCFVYRRQCEALTAYYLDKQYPAYDVEWRNVAKKNFLTNFVNNRLNRPLHERMQNYERMQNWKYYRVWPDFIAFVVLAKQKIRKGSLFRITRWYDTANDNRTIEKRPKIFQM
jgi:hypothetical protein